MFEAQMVAAGSVAMMPAGDISVHAWIERGTLRNVLGVLGIGQRRETNSVAVGCQGLQSRILIDNADDAAMYGIDLRGALGSRSDCLYCSDLHPEQIHDLLHMVPGCTLELLGVGAKKI